MISMKPLGALYRTAFANKGVDIDGLSIFFQRTLRIPNLAYTHIIEELKAIKEQPAARLETIHQLYQLLHQLHQGDSTIADETRQVATPLLCLRIANPIQGIHLRNTLLYMLSKMDPRAGINRPSVFGQA